MARNLPEPLYATVFKFGVFVKPFGYGVIYDYLFLLF